MSEAEAGVESPSESGEVPARLATRGRRRRANVAGGRQHSHRVLVTAEEEARLLLMAHEQGVTVPRLLVESVFAGGGELAVQREQVLAELSTIRRLLRMTSNNVNQIATVANSNGQIASELEVYLRRSVQLEERLRVAVERLDL